MTKAAEPFVHVLLFECPQCSCPVPSAITSDNRNVEEIDARLIPVKCQCGWPGNLLGADAKRHWVESWDSTDGHGAQPKFPDRGHILSQ